MGTPMKPNWLGWQQVRTGAPVEGEVVAKPEPKKAEQPTQPERPKK